MFATYESLKFPVQFPDGSTIWRGVEVMLSTPWLLAMLKSERGTQRTFLLKGTGELLQFIESSDLGRLLSVCLVLPPDRSQSSDWVFLPVCRVERERKPLHSGLPNVVLTTDHGVRYGGHPIGLMGSDNLDRTLVIDQSADAV